MLARVRIRNLKAKRSVFLSFSTEVQCSTSVPGCGQVPRHILSKRVYVCVGVTESVQRATESEQQHPAQNKMQGRMAPCKAKVRTEEAQPQHPRAGVSLLSTPGGQLGLCVVSSTQHALVVPS